MSQRTFSRSAYTPTLGMDKIDGEIAQDAEAQILSETLAYNPQRLSLYGPNNEVAIETYLRDRGILE